MMRWLTIIVLLTIPLIAVGCSGGGGEGPMDASDVPEVDPQEIERGMEESMQKGRPGGGQAPSGSAPGSSESGAPAESSSE